MVPSDLEISIIGECNHPSPLAGRLAESAIHYVGQADRVLLEDRISAILQHTGDLGKAPAFELAGPRHKVLFSTAQLRRGIVTCGGLCPGLNNVVRGLVLGLWHSYGVQEIFGFRYGYAGLVQRHGHGPVRLSRPWLPVSITKVEPCSAPRVAIRIRRRSSIRPQDHRQRAAVVEATGQPAFSDSTMAGSSGSQEGLSHPIKLSVGE